MSISINGVSPGVIQSYGVRAKDIPVKPKGMGADSVQVSENGQLFASALRMARQSTLTETDSVRVGELKAQVQSGSYSVDSNVLADILVSPGEGWQA